MKCQGVSQVVNVARVCFDEFTNALRVFPGRLLCIGRDEGDLAVLAGSVSILLLCFIKMNLRRCIQNDLEIKVRLGRIGSGNPTLTCAFDPPIPNELMLIRLSRSSGQGVAVMGTFRFFSTKGTKIGQNQFAYLM